MSGLWWQLPGPSRFVSRIVQDLRDGKNVMLCLPEHLPDGLSSAIRSALGNSNEWPWHSIQVQEEDKAADPASLLFSRFVSNASPGALWNARTLAEAEDFAGKIIWLDSLSAREWSAWKAFLIDYEYACRSRSMFERSLFCVPLVGELALSPPLEEVCLSHHSWHGAVDLLDMLVFTTTLFQTKQISHLQKRIAVSITAHIALWDPTVSECLARESLGGIFDPIPTLLEIAKERGWDHDCDVLSSCSWHKGMIDVVDEEERIHSAVLVSHGGASAIKQRIWNAEVGVMLPFVEERRQEILTRLAGVLQVPFTTGFGEVITDLRDLEIGHIESQLTYNSTSVSPEVRLLVRRLREIRNCLSHLEPLNPELLLYDEITRASTERSRSENSRLAGLERRREGKKREH